MTVPGATLWSLPMTLESTARGLEETFEMIRRERMADVPILNDALRVEAVEFRDWRGDCLGVLVTPWFMNLMLLRTGDQDEPQLPVGSKVVHTLPSGDYEFIVGEEPGIGRFEMCSLFSPMFEFADQATAVATARAVMAEIIREAEPKEKKNVQRQLSRRDLLRGRVTDEARAS